MGISLKVERIKPEKGYTVIHNHILNDTNLTFKAKGILVLLLSLPPNPRNLSIEQIARKHKDGASAVRSGIDELKDAGYLEVHQINNALGQYDGVLWCLRDTARVAETAQNSQEIPDAENPKPDSPPSEKHGHINTYKTKKPKSKKTTTPGEQSGCAVEDLRFTATMLAETQVLVRKALEQVAPDERQRMLDDFCAAVRAGEIKKSQLGWLHAVIKRYKNGEYNFKPMPPKPVPALDVASPPPAAPNSALIGLSSVKPSKQSSVALEALNQLKKNICKPIS